MKDIQSGLAATVAVVPQVVAATNTSSAIDLQGYAAALLVITTGAIVSSGDYTAKLQESDTTTGGDFTDVEADDLLNTFSASLAENSVERIGYVGSKRYLRTVITKNGGTSIAASAVVMLGHPADAPVS